MSQWILFFHWLSKFKLRSLHLIRSDTWMLHPAHLMRILFGKCISFFIFIRNLNWTSSIIITWQHFWWSLSNLSCGCYSSGTISRYIIWEDCAMGLFQFLQFSAYWRWFSFLLLRWSSFLRYLLIRFWSSSRSFYDILIWWVVS